jgi:hypothetical protein
MKSKKTRNEKPSVLDVVALLKGLPTQRLARGQVGTVVEQLDERTLLVEFSDDQNRACAMRPARGPAHPARRPGSRLIRLIRTRLAFVDAAEEIACADAAGH